jgi:hypothetical protein
MTALDDRPDDDRLLGDPAGLPGVEEDLDDLDEAARSVSLWEGDEGGLELAQRRALVVLVKQRFISARTHPREWRTLLEHRTLLTGRLNDLFLELHVDPVREVAWKRQAVGEAGQRFPTLLHDTAWTREETAVLVLLRDRLRAGSTAGEDRVFVDRDDILDYIAGFRPPHATDASGDEKRARNAVVAVNRMGLLIGGPADDRFEISGAVESLLTLETLRELLAGLRHANAAPAGDDEADDLFTEEEQ